MTENEQIDFMWNLPTEILLYIFNYLPAKELTKCRQVCTRFMQIVDAITSSDIFWRNHCKKEYSNVYLIARNNARAGLDWYHLYRSLSLWPKLDTARETRDEFASASRIREQIKNFQILRSGIIAVHKNAMISFYDIETLDLCKRGPITGEYIRYTENQDSIVILGNHLHLYIFRKILRNADFEPNTTFHNVKTFILVSTTVYFVNLNDEIYVCDLDSSNLSSKFIKKSEAVMCLGYTKNLHVLTFERNIYTVIGDNFVHTCTLGPDSNLLLLLRQYNFLEQFDWRVFLQWMFLFNQNVPEGPLRDIITARAYGNIFFIGSNWGVLRIYYAPYSDDEFDLFSAELLKQYNFMERNDCPVLSLCPILQIDVLEGEDSHTVIVAMPRKIAVINFVHNVKRTASAAMLPYSDVQKVKVLKIEDDLNDI